MDRRAGAGGRTTDYRLTDAGRELGSVVGALNAWGVRWRVPDGGPPDLDPGRPHAVGAPARAAGPAADARVVIEVRLRGRDRRSYWLVLQPGEVSLCPEHPGFEEDLRITTDPTTLYLLFLGRLGLSATIDDAKLAVDGPSLVRALPRWFLLFP